MALVSRSQETLALKSAGDGKVKVRLSEEEKRVIEDASLVDRTLQEDIAQPVRLL